MTLSPRLRVELPLAAGGGLLKGVSVGDVTISGARFGDVRGDSCLGARKAELTSLLQMVIIVTVIAASGGLITAMYSLLPFLTTLTVLHT